MKIEKEFPKHLVQVLVGLGRWAPCMVTQYDKVLFEGLLADLFHQVPNMHVQNVSHLSYGLNKHPDPTPH